MAGAIISYGAGLLESAFGKSTAPIAAVIKSRTEEFEENSQIKNIFSMKTGKGWGEKYVAFTEGHGFVPTDEGGAYEDDDFVEDYSKLITWQTWKNQFSVTQEAIEDDMMDVILSKAKNFTTNYGRTRERYAAAMLAGATATTIDFGIGTSVKTFDTTAADGVALFSAAHTSKTGGYANQSNLFANAFSLDALSYIEEKMMNYRDADGNLLTVQPDTIVIGNNAMLRKAIVAAIDSKLDPDTANNAVNFQAGHWKVIVWPYLSQYLASNDAWFLMDSTYAKDNNTLVFGDRVPLSVRSEIAHNDNNIWKGRARFKAGFVDWRGIALSYATSGGTDATA